MDTAHHCSSSPDCSEVVDVPSRTLLTALSASPFDSGRWSVDAQWFHWRSTPTCQDSHELSVFITFDSSSGSRNFRRILAVAGVVFRIGNFESFGGQALHNNFVCKMPLWLLYACISNNLGLGENAQTTCAFTFGAFDGRGSGHGGSGGSLLSLSEDLVLVSTIIFREFLQPFWQVLRSIPRCLSGFSFIWCQLLGSFSWVFCWTRKVCLPWSTKNGDRHSVIAFANWNLALLRRIQCLNFFPLVGIPFSWLNVPEIVPLECLPEVVLWRSFRSDPFAVSTVVGSRQKWTMSLVKSDVSRPATFRDICWQFLGPMPTCFSCIIFCQQRVVWISALKRKARWDCDDVSVHPG